MHAQFLGSLANTDLHKAGPVRPFWSKQVRLDGGNGPCGPRSTGCTAQPTPLTDGNWGVVAIQITRGADYAVRLLLAIADALPERAQIPDISHREAIPYSFLAKIAQQLRSAGLLKSARGSGGGFDLARPSHMITLRDIVEAVDGPLFLNWCLARPGACAQEPTCPVHDVWVRAQSDLNHTLQETNVASLLTARKARNATLMADASC